MALIRVPSAPAWRRRLRTARARAAVAMLVAAVWPMAGAPAAAFDGVARVGVVVEVTRPVEGLAADDLRVRVTGILERAAPPVAIDPAAPDRLWLRVDLEPRSATDLRGFWLPFSGTYAIGLVGLALERPVVLPAADRRTTAIVWRQDRVVAVPWRSAAAEVGRVADAMLKAWLGGRADP